MDRPGLFPLAALGILVGFVVVMLLLTGGDGSPQAATTTSTPTPTTASLTTVVTTPTTTAVSRVEHFQAATVVQTLDGWEDLNAPFGQRWDAAVEWTGTELLVWGGSADRRFDGGRDDSPTNTGYRYDPASHSWQQLADSELCAMSEASSAWTEGAFTKPELVVWPDGATQRVGDCELYGAYDPATDTWRYLNDDFYLQFFSRLGGESSVVWTGELLVAPSVGLALDPVDGPLLDIPDVPRNADDGVFSQRLAHWTGTEVLVLGSDELFSWRSGDDAWTELPSPPIMDRARTSALDGTQLLAANYELEAARWDGSAWTAAAPVPLRFYECVPRGLSSEEFMALEWCGPFALWDSTRQVFVPVPAPADWSAEHQNWRGGLPYLGGGALYVIGDGAFRYELAVDGEGLLELPAVVPIGVHFLDRPGDMELIGAVGPTAAVVDDQFVTETLTFVFETRGATCSAVSSYLGTEEPPGAAESVFVVARRTGEVVRATEYDEDGMLTVRLPSRNGSDVLDVSCGDAETTRLFAAQFWEPEY